MIIWINGLFGSGKTTTAHALAERIPNSRVVNPEEIGFGLPTWHGNGGALDEIQDDARWRSLTRETVAEVEDAFGIAVVPMTLFITDYYEAIVGELRRDGRDVRHFCLRVGPETALARGAARPDGLVDWALPKNNAYSAYLEDNRYEEFIDSEDLSIEQVVDRIMSSIAS